MQAIQCDDQNRNLERSSECNGSAQCVGRHTTSEQFNAKNPYCSCNINSNRQGHLRVQCFQWGIQNRILEHSSEQSLQDHAWLWIRFLRQSPWRSVEGGSAELARGLQDWYSTTWGGGDGFWLLFLPMVNARGLRQLWIERISSFSWIDLDLCSLVKVLR